MLTQEQVASRAGLNVRTVRRLELGMARRPRSSSVYGLVKALSLSTTEEEELAALARAVSSPAGDVPAIFPSGAEATAGGRPEPDTTPRQLPPVAAHFVGRRTELARLDDLRKESGSAAGPPLSVLIVGGAGMGKTTLALQWCSAVADDFPGGQLYVNLRGFGTLSPIKPLNALAVLLRSLGVAPDEIPDDLAAASALFRTRTANSRLLLLLDNALDSEQVRPLLPAPGSAVVVTSRDQLLSLAARDATHASASRRWNCGTPWSYLSRVSGRTCGPSCAGWNTHCDRSERTGNSLGCRPAAARRTFPSPGRKALPPVRRGRTRPVPIATR